MNIQKNIYYFILFAFFCSKSYATNLTLDKYISQVKGDNLVIEKSSKNAESLELLKRKADLINSIKLYGFSEYVKSEPNRALQFIRYQSVVNQNNRIGLSQDSEYGFNTNLFYSLNSTRYNDFNPTFNTNPLAGKNFQIIPVAEINISLWQNFLGKITKAKIDNTIYDNLSQKYSAKSLSLNELISAEKSFWMLVYAKKAFEIQSRALYGAEKILSHLTKKEQMNLAEKSDVLQAKATVQTKKLLVNQAENFLKICSRDFNKRRNINSDEVSENLVSFDINKLSSIKFTNQKANDRYDIKSQKASLEASIAQATIEEENNKPKFNLYASYSLNQVESERLLAIRNSIDRNAPITKIGVELSMPINVEMSSDIRQGSRLKASSEKIALREKLFQQEVDWNNLIQNLQDYQENLKLANLVEQSQKIKLENERKLLSQGRTSIYQILVFEQEFSNSELNTQQLAQKLHELLAEQKLYQTEN
jgi:outer membrane protein TolC